MTIHILIKYPRTLSIHIKNLNSDIYKTLVSLEDGIEYRLQEVELSPALEPSHASLPAEFSDLREKLRNTLSCFRYNDF